MQLASAMVMADSIFVVMVSADLRLLQGAAVYGLGVLDIMLTS